MGKAPMLGCAADRHGSCCGGPPGIDCADFSKSKHQQRRIEKRQWRAEAETDIPEAVAAQELMENLESENRRAQE